MEAHPCLICQQPLRDCGFSKLACGHIFHVGCIGSAFNVAGMMRCPSCGNVEIGEWIYAQGRRPVHGTNRQYLFDSTRGIGSSHMRRTYYDSATRQALRNRDLGSYVQQTRNQWHASSSSDQPQHGGSARQNQS